MELTPKVRTFSWTFFTIHELQKSCVSIPEKLSDVESSYQTRTSEFPQEEFLRRGALSWLRAEFDELLIFALLLNFGIALFDHFHEHGNARDFKSHTQSDIRILEFFENDGVETIVGLHMRATTLKKIGYALIFAQLIAIQIDELDFQACAVLNHRHPISTQIPKRLT